MILEKWYGDFYDGRTFHIRYAANLKIGALKIGFHGQLSEDSTQNGKYFKRWVNLPELSGDGLAWPDIGHSARVWSSARSCPHVLYSHMDKKLVWDPVVLNGSVQASDGVVFGQGYAERLEMNFAPWQLGLSRLKWGRFCGAEQSLVWIEWQGEINKRLCLRNGLLVDLHSIEQSEVILEPGTYLRLFDQKVLVNELLGTGILERIPLPDALKPIRFLTGRERKFVGVGSLYDSGQLVDHGAVVFEDIVWP